ncbi:hypothetical protein ROHU_022685 [Labeo rohita]|uniref:Uncharacterized protein n=1 Tax=Labeo rohita TaxID=84645 RepID=A0A498MZL2_LABRO|nr:hypothetical protein ROHU_022685 [Labeo rohita]
MLKSTGYCRYGRMSVTSFYGKGLVKSCRRLSAESLRRDDGSKSDETDVYLERERGRAAHLHAPREPLPQA